MKLAIAAFTQAGLALAERVQAGLLTNGHFLSKPTLLRRGGGEGEPTLSQWTRSAWEGDGILFVGAAGIAVRAIAPLVWDKLTDPAVISMDEQGRFVVPLLGGHYGGANQLATEIGAITGAMPVISTATDLNDQFAVDVWAKHYGVHLCQRELAKAVSAGLLDGKTIGLYSDFPLEGAPPRGFQIKDTGELGLCLSLDTTKQPFSRTLHGVPRIVTVGVGCRRGVEDEVFNQAVLETLAAHHISLDGVWELFTIDLKREEPCILAFCAAHGIPLRTASAGDLAAVEGDFTGSAFVREITGVDNVCERAAVLGAGGTLLFSKQSRDGVTIAAAASGWKPRFDQK